MVVRTLMNFQPNLIPKLGCLITLSFFLYCGLKVGTSNTGNPVTDLGWAGTVFLYTTIFITFATMFIAARRANAKGSWLWFFAIIFLWPLSYVYALAINRGS